ncbi:hypothetical protein OL548_34165 (plasmid) [Lysinibacillus sp. MHQ-1]|nr:hypothetical protein OL548_34165 [Lysinibacillus sp. MHQ-1]
MFVRKLTSLYVENGLKDIQIKDVKINVLNQSIVPTVTRNSIKEIEDEMIDNSIYLAVCLHILDNASNEQERILMRKYLDKFMDFTKSLVKKRILSY